MKINNVDVAAPSELRVELAEETSAAEKNALGETVMDFFGVKRTLTLTWAYLSETALSTLLAAAGPGFFPVRYPDPDGTDRQITCRAGKRRTGAKMLRDGRPVWTDVEMELIEQ